MRLNYWSIFSRSRVTSINLHYSQLPVQKEHSSSVKWIVACVSSTSFRCFSLSSIHHSPLGLKVKADHSAKMGVQIKFSNSLETSDPRKNPVTIIGQLENLQKLPYELVKVKLEPRVPEELFKSAILQLQPSPTDSCPLYMNLASVACLPKTISRHNTPSRCHSLTKIVKNLSNLVDEYIVLVVEKSDVFASALAVAKAFPLYTRKTKSDGKEDSNLVVEFLLVSRSSSTGELKYGEEVLNKEDLKMLSDASFTVRNTARIIDTPCNEMHTSQFVKEAEAIGRELGITPLIIRGEELKEKGFGGIYTVGRAAEHPPALVVLSYKPPNAQKTIAWVGKGIVYDTGGLCIKSRTGMCSMKRDCGGASAILNSFYLAVKSGFKENLHAVLCLAENAVGPLATRPDDIITLYSKKTVEVNNTDAEGRLVLGDGVAYARMDLEADIIIDMATLTGAQGIATGKYHAAILTNNEEWENASRDAGRSTGDLVFPLPFAPELHFSEFSSALADMKNSVADRSNAQASCAGLFIYNHLGFDWNGVWCHFDIASPVESGERATGYGVALLNGLFGQYSSNQMLKDLSPFKA